MKHLRFLVPLLAVLLAALLLCACGASGRTADSIPNDEAADSHTELTRLLPAPESLPNQRAVRDSLGYFAGSNFMPALPHPHVLKENSASFLPATTGRSGILDNALCVYLLPVDDSGPLRLALHWQQAPASGEMYAALANYSKGRWDWQALADPSGFDLPSSGDYISGTGIVGLVLLLPAADTAAGPHATASLDYLSLEALPLSGWHWTELYSAEVDLLPGFDSSSISPRVFNYQGRPAISMYQFQYDFESATEMPGQLQLALSSTATGRDLADWSFQPVMLNGQTRSAQFAELPGGMGAVWSELPVEAQPRILHYGYSSDLSQGFSDETVTAENLFSSFQLAAVGGLPGLAFGTSDSPSPEYGISYASSSALQGGTWSVAPVHADDRFSVTLAAGLLELREVNGLPMFAYYNVANSGTGFTVAAAKVLQPAGPADWNLARLAVGSGDVLSSLMLNGKPAFASASRIVLDPDVCSFWTYELSGSDPGDSASWDVTHYDGLNFGTHAAVGFAANGSELSFVHQQQVTFGDGGDGIFSPLELWTSAAPGNTPAAWQTVPFLQDSDLYVQLAYFDGKLVALRTENLPLGSAPATRYCTKIVWGVLEN